jgi:hypothetical protein
MTMIIATTTISAIPSALPAPSPQSALPPQFPQSALPLVLQSQSRQSAETQTQGAIPG